jgi:hypothetical protein
MQNEERGLSQLGSPLSKIVSSLQVVDSTQDTPPNSSATGGSLSPARKASNSTGLQRGGRGAGGKPSVYQHDRVAEAQLTLPVRSWLKDNEVVEIVHGEDGQFEEARLVRYEGDCDCVTDADRAVLDAAMVPATDQQLVPLLATLWEMTSHAQSGGDNLKLKFRGFARLLQQDYPADVAVEAIQRWQDREKWWPSWAELKGECDRLANWRRVTREALG